MYVFYKAKLIGLTNKIFLKIKETHILTIVGRKTRK